MSAWLARCGLVALFVAAIASAAPAANNGESSSKRNSGDWLQHEQGALATTDAEAPFASRSLDQLWVVSCRGLGTRNPGRPTEALRYWRLNGAGVWTPSDREAFAAGDDPDLTTCAFVPGYSYTSAETRQIGLRAYRGLSRGAPSSRGVRFVIWSWPSDQGDNGVIRDVRAVAARTDRVAWYFAQWLAEAAPERRVTLIGTSFGARIVGGALHLLGGGRLGFFELEDSHPAPPLAQVVFVSPAIDDDWLLPGRRFGGAWPQVERMLLVNNSADRTLKRYHWLYGPRSQAEALGHAGLRRGALPDGVRERVVQLDAAHIIGSQHGCGPYFESPALLARMRPYMLEPESSGPFLKGLTLPTSLSGSQ